LAPTSRQLGRTHPAIRATILPTIAPLLAAAAALLTGCSASVPPCNAIIWLFGAADLTLDCPAISAIPLLQRHDKDNPPP